MDWQIAQSIRILSWDLLLTSGAAELPVKITPIGGLYELTSAIDYDRSRFDNMCRLSNFILNIYGYQHTYEESRWLAIRVLSPLVVLHDCEVTSAEEIGFLTGIPIPATQARLERLREITGKGLFKNNFFERKVSESFGGFCARYTSVK